MHIAIVGGGLAGAALTWRLAGAPGMRCTLFAPESADASRASGGVVRRFDRDDQQRALAGDSLTELLTSSTLRAWTAFRPAGFTYLFDPGSGLDEPAALAIKQIEHARPGSVEIGRPPAWMSDGSALVEHEAGRIDTDRFRSNLLMDAARSGASVHRAPVLTAEPGLVTTAHGRVSADVVVVAAGAWTPGLMRGQRDAEALRSKVIRYTVHRYVGPCPTGFLDEASGLYGVPVDDGLLLGLPTEEWDVEPGADHGERTTHHNRVAALAQRVLPGLEFGRRLRTAAAADCYHSSSPVLELRTVAGTDARLATFTGGSGGAAKTVLAASNRAATRLSQL